MSSPGPDPAASPPQGCGGPPRLVAIGIAPLGIVSIGIVPMGVVSIGVVPMGVLSVGAVGMGMINACVVGMGILVAGVNVMGVWWAGMEGMGPFRLGADRGALHRSGHGHGHGTPGSGPVAPNLYAYPSREQALRRAAELGCSGVHAMGFLWMPCAQHPGGPEPE
ncbi:MAG: hypothetical protein ACKO6F_03990 [Cyanobium sp.]